MKRDTKLYLNTIIITLIIVLWSGMCISSKYITSFIIIKDISMNILYFIGSLAIVLFIAIFASMIANVITPPEEEGKEDEYKD